MPPTLVPAPSAPPFRPSRAQLRLLDAIHESISVRSVVSLCDAAGVPRATYYRWCQNPDFRLWFAASWSARLMVDGSVLINVARSQCSHSFPYWKALFELTFDPKGLSALQKWQQNLTQLDPSAFESAQSPDPGPGPALASPLPPSNQALTPENETVSAPPGPPPLQPGLTPSAAASTPLQIARRFHRVLAPRRPHRRLAQRPARRLVLYN